MAQPRPVLIALLTKWRSTSSPAVGGFDGCPLNFGEPNFLEPSPFLTPTSGGTLSRERALSYPLRRVRAVEQSEQSKSGSGTLKRRLAYHFTHVLNLPRILSDGELRSDSLVSSLGSLSVEISDPEVKAKRRQFVVPIPPGGVLADYVPFYFAPRSPTLFRAASGRVPGFDGGQDELVFLVVDLDSLIAFGRSVVVTDGHPIACLTLFLPDRHSVEEGVDWELMDKLRWADTEADGDRLRRRQAELLVQQSVPLGEVLGFAVRSEKTQEVVAALLRDSPFAHLPVLVRSAFYYVGKP